MSTSEELNKQYLEELAGQLAGKLLQLAGAPNQPADIVYNNLAELLTAALAKIEEQRIGKDEYPYTFELFVEEIEARLRYWYDQPAKHET